MLFIINIIFYFIGNYMRNNPACLFIKFGRKAAISHNQAVLATIPANSARLRERQNRLYAIWVPMLHRWYFYQVWELNEVLVVAGWDAWDLPLLRFPPFVSEHSCSFWRSCSNGGNAARWNLTITRKIMPTGFGQVLFRSRQLSAAFDLTTALKTG